MIEPEKTEYKGLTFFKFYKKDKIYDCNISYKGENTVRKGYPFITIRFGPSYFGEQILFGFETIDGHHIYNAKTNYEAVEIYWTIEEGINFMKNVIEWWEKNKK